ncbi:hypothetical protein [Hyphococcus sp. DH-69]|uniref:hypothetical protein n=1 Tax=Hyphococcus formosus TaxID=3143534 RepID=UPI00398A5EA2
MTKQMLKTAAAALAIMSLSATGACASKSAEIVAPLSVSNSQMQNAAALSSQWVDGRRQEMTGLEHVEEGGKLIRKAQKDERKATEKLNKAVTESDEQRAAYVRLVAGFGGASMPSAVETEIKALKKAADDWSDAYKRVEKQKSRVSDAQLEIANGESMVRTGNEMIATGREKMRVAEAESQGYQSDPTVLIADEPLVDMN